MKKSVVCALIIALCMQCGALAETIFWTRNEDLYYHGAESCGGGEGRVPISQTAAQAFDKYACPVCCTYGDAPGEVEAVSRGGTIAVRFSDTWLSGLEFSSVFGWSADNAYRGMQAQRALAQYLHDADYGAFLNDYFEDGSAEGRAYVPDILPDAKTLVMSARHINNYWYVIVRPGDSFKNSWDMHWRVNSLSLRMENGVLSRNFDRQSVEEIRALPVESMSGSKPVLERTSEETEIAVYQGLDGNIAVIREKNPGKRRLEDVQLCINGEIVCEGLCGYADGRAAVYCCMITDGELNALERSARIEMRHTESVNEEIYRVAGETGYGYLSLETDEELFEIALENGRDPVDDDFRLVLDGTPDCFVVQTDANDFIMDYDGNEYHPGFMDSNSPQRITPLVWYGESGVFLAEDYQGESFSVGEYLLADGIEFGKKYELEKTKGDGYYHCWLLSERGETILGANRNAFTIFENGEIHMESMDGEIAIYNAQSND